MAATPGARLLDSSARIIRPRLADREGEGLLLEIVVERRTAAPVGESLEHDIRRRADRLLRARMTGVIPFVSVSVLQQVEPTRRFD